MRLSDATAVIAMLRSYFPGWRLEDADVPLWARLLARSDYEMVDAMEAVEELALSPYPPRSPGELLAAMKESRNLRLSSLSALDEGEGDAISFSEWLERYATPEQRDTVAAVGLKIEEVAS